ncbi:MCE family protein [Kutzneria sp. 744]|uniref:MCE family protein n=1 Tax=Kutzneria sp. (strain 744) TaxID=345341 RepID=UPI0003EEA456|nr:MCE family protein [Kutzneria sp. 744]EWM13309.1 ABC transporter substrate-binding protein [Kutzneria sp. 744]
MKRSFLELNPVVVAIVGVTVTALVTAAVFFADELPFGTTGYTAYFTETAGLKPSDEVAVAGVKVGEVTAVTLDGAQVRVGFRVHGAWIGDATTASIEIKTLLGQKYLQLDPKGSADQNPGQPIPRRRTAAPYDVVAAFDDLASTVTQIDTGQLAQSFSVLADTFRNAPAEIRATVDGLSSLSRTISSRDTELRQLLAGTNKIGQTLADRDEQFRRLIGDGALLLQEVKQRRQAIAGLLTGSVALGQQLKGLVADNAAQLGPTLTQLDQVTAVLQRNQANLDKGLALLGPYYRLLDNALGNGRWIDSYLCGLVPATPGRDCVPPGAKGN